MTIFHLHMQELLATDLDYTTAADTLQLVNVSIHCCNYRNGLLEHEKPQEHIIYASLLTITVHCAICPHDAVIQILLLQLLSCIVNAHFTELGCGVSNFAHSCSVQWLKMSLPTYLILNNWRVCMVT